MKGSKKNIKQVEVEAKYYKSIVELPLSRFIDVMVDDNLYALVITGKPTDEELSAAWEHIRIEYADAIKDYEYRMLCSLEREVTDIDITHNKILIAIATLEKYYCIQFATALNKLLRTSFKFDTRFPDEYDNDLKRAHNRSKGIFLSLQLKQSALEAMRNKHVGKDKKPSREYYLGILITLSDYATYPIHDNITVFEFCDRIRRLHQHYEQIKVKPNGRR